MLKSISIKNLLLIETLQVDFHPHFNVITGETGSGKSVFIEALKIGLGEKLKNNFIQPGKDALEISLNFIFQEINTSFPKLKEFFNPVVLSRPPFTLVLKRQVKKDSRSTCSINQIPVPLSKLREVGMRLVDLHSQHQNQALFNPKSHLAFLDAFLAIEDTTAVYQKNYFALKKTQAQLRKLIEKEKQLQQEKDFLQFTLKELDQNLLTVEVFKNTKKLLEKLEIAETTREKFLQLENELYQNLLPSLEKTLPLFPAASFENEKLLSAQKQLVGLQDSLKSKNLTENYTEQIDALHKKLIGVEKLQKNYAMDLEALWLKKQAIEQKFASIENDQSEKEKLKKKYYLAKRDTLKIALQLRIQRKHGAQNFANQINHEIHCLGMQNAQLKVNLIPEKLTSENETIKYLKEFGIDEAEFLYLPEKNSLPKPLSKIASGGEISRVMFVIKMILSKQLPIVTMTFDEIDTGVGGETALELGKKIKTLAQKKQVIAITHLPQIAKFADRHFHILKETTPLKTSSKIQSLTQPQRLLELARMLGKKNSPFSIELAKEFVRDNAN